MRRAQTWAAVLALRPEWEGLPWLPMEALRLYLALVRDGQPTPAEEAARVRPPRRWLRHFARPSSTRAPSPE